MLLPSDLQRALAERVAALGFEVVECRVGGARRRPLIQLRIDRPDAGAARGITVGECAEVSRALEPWLDAEGVGEGRYVLEVSSPGLERPLRRPDEWRRFLGHGVEILVPALNGRFQVRALEVIDGPDGSSVVLEFPGGVRRTLKLAEIKEARLAFEW
ncbi:MAG TPA: ribosome maturation factor RimP [Gemmatimonadales bacterium]|nr:ribosome maturation factor RimP [Gemmatimonadales bacterium]